MLFSTSSLISSESFVNEFSIDLSTSPLSNSSILISGCSSSFTTEFILFSFSDSIGARKDSLSSDPVSSTPALIFCSSLLIRMLLSSESSSLFCTSTNDLAAWFALTLLDNSTSASPDTSSSSSNKLFKSSCSITPEPASNFSLMTSSSNSSTRESSNASSSSSANTSSSKSSSPNKCSSSNSSPLLPDNSALSASDKSSISVV